MTTSRSTPSGSVAAKIRRIFGHRLRAFRERTGQSQEQFAKQIGLHRTYISHLERGLHAPRLEIVAKLAFGLGVSIAALTEGIDGLMAAEARQTRSALRRSGNDER